MTDVGELVVRIRADAAQLQAEMAKATGTVKHSSDEMSSALEEVKSQFAELVPALGVAAFVEFDKKAMEAADNLYILGQRTGFATEILSKLNIPLQQNGSSVDEFANSMKFLSRNIEKSTPEVIDIFNQLGLSVTKLKELSPEEKFYAVADAMSHVTDQGKFTNDGVTLMSRGFASIAPLIKAAAGNMEDFVRAQDGLTKEQIAKVHEYDDAWVSFWEHEKIGAVIATTALGNYIEKLAELEKFKPGNNAKAPVMGVGTIPAWPTDGESWKLGAPEKDKSAQGGNSDVDGSAKAAAASAKAMADYIQNLQDETAALSLGKEKLAEYRAEKAAATAAGIELSDMTEADKQAIDDATAAYERQKDAIAQVHREQEKQIQMTAQLEAETSSALADISLDYKNFGATVSAVSRQIAKEFIEADITNPFVNSLGQAFGAQNMAGHNAQGGGFFSSIMDMLPHFANGGVTGSGPIVVGDGGEAEVWTPPQGGGTITPMSKIGGQTVNVYQTFSLNPGATEQTVAQLRNLVPAIMSGTHASVFQALRNGGPEAKTAGLRP